MLAGSDFSGMACPDGKWIADAREAEINEDEDEEQDEAPAITHGI